MGRPDGILPDKPNPPLTPLSVDCGSNGTIVVEMMV
jgi:hypothetical protein